MHPGSTERIYSHVDARCPDCVHIDNIVQVVYIGRQEIVAMRGRCR